MTKLTIGMATGGSVKTDTVASLLAAIPRCPQPVRVSFQSGYPVHYAREVLFRDAVSAGMTHLMFIDADMKFPPDGIAKLLSHEKPVVGAMYNRRGLPLGRTTIGFYDENGNYEMRPFPHDEIFECGHLGTGFMLVDLAQVSSLVEVPRFWYDMATDGNLITEDVWFCVKVREAGLTVWCDPTICVEHIGDYLY